MPFDLIVMLSKYYVSKIKKVSCLYGKSSIHLLHLLHFYYLICYFTDKRLIDKRHKHSNKRGKDGG